MPHALSSRQLPTADLPDSNGANMTEQTSEQLELLLGAVVIFAFAIWIIVLTSPIPLW